MNTSEQINELGGALAKAQGAIKGALKSEVNPCFRSKYADLAATWDACRDALSANGLSVVQVTGGDDPQIVRVTTRLIHASGQWIEGVTVMRPVKADPQGIGSTITYARRYALAAIVGVAPEDDDGNAASSGQETPSPAKITEKQAADLDALIEEVGADHKGFVDWLKIDALTNLPASEYERAVKALERKRKAVKEAA